MTKVHNLIECLKNWVVEVVVNLKLRVACSKYIGIGFFETILIIVHNSRYPKPSINPSDYDDMDLKHYCKNRNGKPKMASRNWEVQKALIYQGQVRFWTPKPSMMNWIMPQKTEGIWWMGAWETNLQQVIIDI